MKAIAHCDGACNVATDRAGGYGFTLHLEDGRRIEQYGGMGLGATNNLAEYKAVRAALYAAAKLGVTDIIIRTDSRLVVEQMNGRWKVKHENMKASQAVVKKLMAHFKLVRFAWIPREENARADYLSKAGLGLERGLAHRNNLRNSPFQTRLFLSAAS